MALNTAPVEPTRIGWRVGYRPEKLDGSELRVYYLGANRSSSSRFRWANLVVFYAVLSRVLALSAINSRPTKSASRWLGDTGKVATPGDFDPEGICVFPCLSFLASLFEKIFAVINIAVSVTLKSANCRHPFSIDALPMRVRPAKQNKRCTQKTCSEDCPNNTRGLIAALFVIDCERISKAATAPKSRILIAPRCHLSKRNSKAPNSKPCASFRRMMKQTTPITTDGTTTRLAHASISRLPSAQRTPSHTPTNQRNCQAQRSNEPISFKGIRVGIYRIMNVCSALRKPN